jgi:signal transduction histidine kinase
VTGALAEALTPVEVAEVIVTQARQAFGARTGIVAMLDGAGTTFTVVRMVGFTPEAESAFATFPATASLPIADAVRAGRAVVLTSRQERDGRYPALANLVERSDDGPLVALPMIARGHPMGGMALRFAEGHSFTDDDLAFMTTLAQQCGQALERAGLYEDEQTARVAAEAAGARSALLAEAGALLAASLDPARTLQQVADLAIPRIADLCVVYLSEPDDTIRRVAIAHVDPEQVALLHELQRVAPIDLHDTHPAARVIRDGVALVDPEIPQSVFTAAEEISRQKLRLLMPRPLLVVPLNARGQVFGAISLGITTSGRTYGAADLQLAESLATRAALAIDNARLYAQAQEALQIRDEFLAIAAHELKSPVTVLMGNADLLLRRMTRPDAATSERELRGVRQIHQQAERLSRQVELLLDLSRIQAGRMNLDRHRLDLVGLARRVVEEVETGLEHHTLVLVTPEEPLMIDGDVLRLEQVLHNLLQNAVKYTPNGGEITVTLERQMNTALLAVGDPGIGIPADAQAHLFERFYRARNATELSVRGFGIGLDIVLELVTLHGGRIDVESVEGQGSTFTVQLPLIAEEELQPAGAAAGAEAA